jgi:hypothetical protein
VPAGDHQGQQRGLEQAVLELGGLDVGPQVVDPEQRQVVGEREPLGRRHPDQQRADQAGPGGDGDGVDVGQAHAGLDQRLVHRGQHQLEVGPGRDLGDHAAEGRVQLRLGGHDVGAQRQPILDDADGGLVAGGLDAQDQHALAHLSLMISSAGSSAAADRRHRITASSPSG